MKKIHVIGIVVIAIAIGAIVSTMSSASTYASFAQAAQNPGDDFHVVGKLNKGKEFTYDPQTDANLFIFYMMDNEGVEKKVTLNRPKPQDFERSEQIVIIGKCDGNDFYAYDILMKCPSKYNNGTPEATTANIN
jgi:cytochrome c-type biogenesis protein CcmE